MLVPIQIADILEQDDLDVVLIPVNCIGVMGAGLARQFKRKYPAMCTEYFDACASGRINREVVASTDVATGIEYIFLPTKWHWKDMSNPTFINQKIRLLEHYRDDWASLNVGVPLLGCGLGQLDPLWVVAIFDRTFRSIGITPTFYGL